MYSTNEQSNRNESVKTGAGTLVNLFEVGSSKEHDMVRRTIAQLNKMTEYGATQMTLNRTVKVSTTLGNT